VFCGGFHAANCVSIALWQFSFAFGKEDFFSYILRPVLEECAGEDKYCAAYLKLRGSLPLSRLLLAKITAHVLETPMLLRKLLQKLPLHIFHALRLLTFNGAPFAVSALEREIGEALMVHDYTLAEYKPALDYALALCILKMPESSGRRDQEPLVSLTPELQTILRRHFIHEEAEPMPVLAQAPKALFTHNSEAYMVQNATALWLFVQSGNVQYASTGEKPLKSSLRAMKEMCGLPEFFPTIYRDFDGLTAQLLITFFNEIPVTQPSEQPLDLLKVFVAAIRKSKFSIRYGLLSMLRSGFIAVKEHPTGEAYLELLHSLPAEKFVSFDALRQYVVLNKERFALYDERSEQNVFVAPATRHHTSKFPNQRTMSITKEYYEEAVTMTALRGMMFLFAALGMVEIVYDEPMNPAFQLGSLSYFSPYDALRGVKITELGRFLVGATKTYSLSQPADFKTYSVQFDDQHLIASIHPLDQTRMMQAPRFMNPIMLNAAAKLDHAAKPAEKQVLRKYFKMEYGVFLSACTSKEDVQRKISQFCLQMGVETGQMPRLWQEFFANVLAKVNPLHKMSRYEVFTFLPSPELMRLLTSDSVLRTIVLKAEGHHILVESKNVERLVKRLREFGYLMA
jgi:hypothetical protein